MCIICIMWARQGNWRLRGSLRGRRKKLRERGVGERREIQSPNLPFSILSCPYPLPFRLQLRRILQKLKSKASTQAKEAFNLIIHIDLTPRICVAVPTL